MSGRTRWGCGVCKKPILRDELFTFFSKGPVHFTCPRDEARKKIGPNLLPLATALIDLLEAELNILVKYKRYIATMEDKATRDLFEMNEKDAEKHAAILTKALDRLIYKA